MEDIEQNYALFQEEFLNERFLLRTPYPSAAIVGLYLYIIFSYGPAYMKGKEPFQLKNIILVYDIIQILLNMYLVYAVISGLISTDIDIFTMQTAPGLLVTGYMYYLVKLFDLIETVFFVLKKKNSQISFLHVYHHVIIITMSYLGFRSLGYSGHISIYVIINCIVHVVMYTYYFMSAYNPGAQYIGMKKFVTQIQLLQFVFLTFLAGVPFFFGHSHSGRGLSFLAMTQSMLMIYLFGKFYIKTYMTKSVQK